MTHNRNIKVIYRQGTKLDKYSNVAFDLSFFVRVGFFYTL